RGHQFSRSAHTFAHKLVTSAPLTKETPYSLHLNRHLIASASRDVLQNRSMSSQLESREAAILSRVIQPDSGDWSPAAAEAILRIGFNETDRERMTALLEKAKAGELTNDESEALEHYRHIGKLLELMKSRARRSLQTSPA